MQGLENKRVLVIGLGASGLAACDLLHRRGAKVVAVDSADTPTLRASAALVRARGIQGELSAIMPPPDTFDFAVISPGVPNEIPLARELRKRGVPIISELELGYQHLLCLNIAITGTNGKTTTTELIERLLTHNHIKTLAAGNIGLPICAVVDKTKELDFVTLEVSSFQLEKIEFFRPIIGVLLNITPDHLDRYQRMADYVSAKARLFMNQQVVDWAVIQSEALAQLRALDISVPSKTITFSANNRRADIYLDHGLIISRMADWPGPLLDMDRCQVRGPHNAENLMAALAVGRVLRLPLEIVAESLKSYTPAPHRCEFSGEINGVRFINDSKATNLDALRQAILSVPKSSGGEPNIWLIAGGKDKGFEYHDIGPLLSRRVKGAFLIGETREKIRAAWNLFTPCALMDSLLEAVAEAARRATSGEVVLLSPACSSFDQFRNYQHRGEVFREAVKSLEKSVARGENFSDGNPEGDEPTAVNRTNSINI